MLTETAITIVSAPAPARNARSQTDHEVEHLPEEDLGDARRPSAIAEDDTLWSRYPSKRAEFLFFCPQQDGEWMTIQDGEWMTIQGQENGDQSEAGRLSRRVILGQKTTLGATDLLCHSYQRKPCA